MKYVIIKFYGNEVDPDFHDLYFSEYENDMIEIHKYAERNGSQLFVTCITNNGLDGPAISGDVFAEVEYTEALTEEEKCEYVNFIRKFSKTAEIKRKQLCEYETLKMVSFKRIDSDIRIL